MRTNKYGIPICIFMLLFMLLSCTKKVEQTTILRNTAGTFVVVNVDTGEDLTLYDLVPSKSFELNAHNGETLQFKFTPDEQNRKYTFDVSVVINGKTIKLVKTTDEETYTGEYAISNLIIGESTVNLAADYKYEDDETIITIWEHRSFTLKIEQ